MEAYLSYLIILGSGILLALIVLPIAGSYLWNRYWRPRRIAGGHATDKFNGVMKRALRFMTREDRTSLFEKAPKENGQPSKPLSPFMQKITWRKFYLVLFLLTLGLALAKSALALAALGFMALVMYARVSHVFKERHKVLVRMFEVASKKLGYPRGEIANPWAWVTINKWETLTEPKDTVVVYPTGFEVHSQMSRESFEQHFTTVITEKNSWIYDWQPKKNQVVIKPVPPLPEMAPYPGSETFAWNEIPIGEGPEGPVAYDVAKSPHVLLAGPTGSGKSVLQRSVIFHCIQHNDMWNFVGVDLKRVELSQYRDYKRTVKAIAVDLESAADLIREVERNMMERFTLMEEHGVDHFTKLRDERGKHPKAIMLMVDEAYALLSPEGSKSEEGKARDQLHAECVTMLGSIARLGRAAGVHMLIATQRPDAAVIPGELRNNLETRIAAGRLNSTASGMILDSGAGTRIPAIKGRGMLFFLGEYITFQGYFADKTWINAWLEGHKEQEPSMFGLPDDEDDVFGDEEDGIDFVADEELEFKIDEASRSRIETYAEPEAVSDLEAQLHEFERIDTQQDAFEASMDPFEEARKIRARRAREDAEEAFEGDVSGGFFEPEPEPEVALTPAPVEPVVALPRRATRPAAAPAEPVVPRQTGPAVAVPAPLPRQAAPARPRPAAPVPVLDVAEEPMLPPKPPVRVPAQMPTRPARPTAPAFPGRPNFPGRG
jgi:hypothetical protein